MRSIAMGIFPPPVKLLSMYGLPLWYINVLHISCISLLSTLRRDELLHLLRTKYRTFLVTYSGLHVEKAALCRVAVLGPRGTSVQSRHCCGDSRGGGAGAAPGMGRGRDDR